MQASTSSEHPPSCEHSAQVGQSPPLSQGPPPLELEATLLLDDELVGPGPLVLVAPGPADVVEVTAPVVPVVFIDPVVAGPLLPVVAPVGSSVPPAPPAPPPKGSRPVAHARGAM